MKVILLKDVRGVGQSGSVVDVADGYGLNFLVARGLGMQATPEKLSEHQKRAASTAAAKEKEEAELARAVQGLHGARVEIIARASEKGGLFRSIAAADIASAIMQQKKARIPAEAIKLDKPIKQTGEHPIEISAANAHAKLTFVVNSPKRPLRGDDDANGRQN